MFIFCFRHERYQLRGDCLKFEIISKSTIANVHKECTEKYTYKKYQSSIFILISCEERDSMTEFESLASYLKVPLDCVYPCVYLSGL